MLGINARPRVAKVLAPVVRALARAAIACQKRGIDNQDEGECHPLEEAADQQGSWLAEKELSNGRERDQQV